jgi:hypothetical protein
MTVTAVITISGQRPDSLYLNSNQPLLEEELVDVPSPTSEVNDDNFGAEGLSERPMAQGRDMMIDLLSKKVGADEDEHVDSADTEQRAELQLFGTEKHMSSLQDLNHLLYTRDRLQELGCMFTTMGELESYGHTVTLKEIEQLLRLGPIYDEQWSSSFASTPTMRGNDAAIWSDMRSLKRVLTNESVVFDSTHRRLPYGDGGARLLRLCSTYDDLYKLWSAMHPNRVLTSIVEQEENSIGGFDDSGFSLKDECDRGDDMKTQTGECTTWRHSKTSSVPRNIGWRFSDDIIPRCNSMSDCGYNDMGEKPQGLITTPLQIVKDGMARDPPSVQPEEPRVLLQARADRNLRSFSQVWSRPSLTAFQVKCRYSHTSPAAQLTSAQRVTTPSRVCMEQQVTHPHNGASIGIDMATKMHLNEATTSVSEESVKAQSTKRKGFRGWWRRVFGRTGSASPQPL